MGVRFYIQITGFLINCHLLLEVLLQHRGSGVFRMSGGNSLERGTDAPYGVSVRSQRKSGFVSTIIPQKLLLCFCLFSFTSKLTIS